MYQTQCSQPVTLAAGIPLTVTIWCSQWQNLGVGIFNTGANPIGTTVVKRSEDGTNFATDTASGTAIGSIAAGQSALLEITGNSLSCMAMQLILTSSVGTTATVQWTANRSC